ncbi:hypothetical protein QCA50_008514 [Cerrena zonata]|uniref:F-box domain-containing protein n=1 Tax=Cerrena zonata TaxID=2478898 RepID=A0AAW0G9U2_9APHY
MLLPTTQRRFPNEIIDWIIDYLWGENPTLAVCSRVAKSWLPRCRVNLFECLVWARRCKDGTSHSFDDLVEYLKIYPHLRPYIKSLALVHHRKRDAPLCEVEQRPWLCEVTLRSLLSVLPKLIEIQIVGVRLGDGNADPCHDICSHSPSTSESKRFKLDSLVLNHFGNPGGEFGRIYNFLELFESVERLCIFTLYWNSKDMGEDVFAPITLSRYSPLPSLRTPSFKVCTRQNLLHLLGHILPVINSIEGLGFTCYKSEDAFLASEQVHRIGSNLQALDLNLSMPIYYEVDDDGIHVPIPQELWRQLFFTKCCALQRILVSMSCWGGSLPPGLNNSKLLSYALDILSECPPTIVEAGLWIDCYDVTLDSAVREMDWKRLRDLVQTWKHLSRITFHFKSTLLDRTTDKTEPFVLAEMAPAKRDKLDIEVWIHVYSNQEGMVSHDPRHGLRES